MNKATHKVYLLTTNKQPQQLCANRTFQNWCTQLCTSPYANLPVSNPCSSKVSKSSKVHQHDIPRIWSFPNQMRQQTHMFLIMNGRHLFSLITRISNKVILSFVDEVGSLLFYQTKQLISRLFTISSMIIFNFMKFFLGTG